MEFVLWARIDKEFVVEAPDAEMAKRYVKRFADGTIREDDVKKTFDVPWAANCSAVVGDHADSLDLQIKVDNEVDTWDELYGGMTGRQISST
jgi:hypothetical protein